MLKVLEERSECNQIDYEGEEQNFRIWDEGNLQQINLFQVAQSYRSQIEGKQLQQQLWQNSMQKVFQENNGVPKKYLERIRTLIMRKSSKCCSICCNQFESGEVIMQLHCKHIFHEKCAKPWFKSSRHCPNCREDIVEQMKKGE